MYGKKVEQSLASRIDRQTSRINSRVAKVCQGVVDIPLRRNTDCICGSGEILLALVVNEEKSTVFDDRSANSGPILVVVKRNDRLRNGIGRVGGAPVSEVIPRSVKTVSAAF